ncbi:MAG: F0F1 ATP synthase subunit B [Gammaproteobacteria bacterium]|nr:F0F1 ATP synthase subunit B [Gammaproteobacteria bacterium]
MNINATFLGQMIAMAFFVWFCSKYVWPPFIAIMEERRKKIADGLEAAARSEKDLELAQVKSAEKLNEAKSGAAAIIDQANKRAAQIVDEAKEQAREEGQRIIAGANAEIEQEVNRAKEALRSQVSAIAVAGAEKILEGSVDQAANEEMLSKLAAEL